MHNNNQPPPDKGHLDNFLLQIALALFNGYIACFTLFLRNRIGSSSLGMGVLGGACVQWLWMENYPVPEMETFFFVWLGAVAFQMLRHSIEKARGQVEDRQYGGWPVVVKSLPLLGHSNEPFAKCVVEPAIVYLLSFGMAAFSPGLGKFFAWGSFAMVAMANLQRAVFNEKVASIRDAARRNRILAEALRNQR